MIEAQPLGTLHSKGEDLVPPFNGDMGDRDCPWRPPGLRGGRVPAPVLRESDKKKHSSWLQVMKTLREKSPQEVIAYMQTKRDQTHTYTRTDINL